MTKAKSQGRDSPTVQTQAFVLHVPDFSHNTMALSCSGGGECDVGG